MPCINPSWHQMRDRWVYNMGEEFTPNSKGGYINASKMPYDYSLANMVDIADTETPEKFYITSKGCEGILRRKYEHNAGMNERLEAVLRDCSNLDELRKLGLIS